MKHDFTAVRHPATAARKMFFDWLCSTRGMPLKVSAVGAVTCVVASIGVGLAFGTEADDLLKAEQMKACREITGKTNTEIGQMRAKCQVIYPGLLGP